MSAWDHRNQNGKSFFSLTIVTIALGLMAFTRSPSITKSQQMIQATDTTIAAPSMFTSWPLQKSDILSALKKQPFVNEPNLELPEKINLSVLGKPSNMQVRYTYDPYLQKQVKELFKQYKPDYAAFVAVEPETGRILSFVSSSQKKAYKGNIVLQATYPAASVFKMVTAAAAIESRQFHPNSEIAFTGKNHTLYRRNVSSQKVTRWTRNMTLKEAFGKSVNTVFAKIGMFHVGGQTLQNYAEKFGFNQNLHFDLPLSESQAIIPSDDWGIAEAASGFTTDITLSPIQGAMMAAAVANGGVMMEPYLIQELIDSNGTTQYQASPRSLRVVMGQDAAEELKTLMKETVEHGTSRKFFRPLLRHARANEEDWEMGGKTGSLTGRAPHGKYDWFVGYADFRGKKVAVAALTIHEKYWRVKSAYLARRVFESFLKTQVVPPKNLNLKYASRKN